MKSRIALIIAGAVAGVLPSIPVILVLQARNAELLEQNELLRDSAQRLMADGLVKFIATGE